MNNPLSDDPKLALYPLPPGCAGNRLWRLLHDRTGATKAEYVRGFERVNLVIGEWDRVDARAAADEFIRVHQGRRAVILGASVRTAFRLPPVLVTTVLHRGVYFRQLPHPSGRCRWYNDPKNRAVAGMLLEEELRR
jgi:hypothetical protein